MTSDTGDEAYVWIWLPGHTDPVVAGRLERRGALLAFNYGRSYLARDDAVAVYAPELPLRRGRIEPQGQLLTAGCISDAGPDAWGQRVIRHRLGDSAQDPDLLTLLLLSGSDRFGALDFQTSPSDYRARSGGGTLEQLLHVAERVDAGEPIPDDLADAALRGTSLGGERPKAVVHDGDRQLIAKFSLSTDVRNVVGAEALAMELGRRVGLDVVATEVVSMDGRNVLLVERFDRDVLGGRRRVVSALTILGLRAETEGRYATYTDAADHIRRHFTDPGATLTELFSRIVLNMCVSNIDDHARNHAAFVAEGTGGMQLTLTPAYDICPQPRTRDTASQAMAYGPDGARTTRFEPLVEAAAHYQLSADQARGIIDQQVQTIVEQCEDAAKKVGLSPADRDGLWGRQILHPSLVHGYHGRAAEVVR